MGLRKAVGLWGGSDEKVFIKIAPAISLDKCIPGNGGGQRGCRARGEGRGGLARAIFAVTLQAPPTTPSYETAIQKRRKKKKSFPWIEFFHSNSVPFSLFFLFLSLFFKFERENNSQNYSDYSGGLLFKSHGSSRNHLLQYVVFLGSLFFWHGLAGLREYDKFYYKNATVGIYTLIAQL